MSKRFGIRITLPSNSTLQFNHLLGKDWETFRWYSSENERDDAFLDMQSQPSNYRKGDIISQCLEKVEKTT